MIITWDFCGKHLLRLNADMEMHLYCDFDEHGSPTLYLEVGDKKHIVAYCDDILLSHKTVRLDEHDIIEYYSSVVREVLERISQGDPHHIDLNGICDFVLRYEWLPRWSKNGLVSEE